MNRFLYVFLLSLLGLLAGLNAQDTGKTTKTVVLPELLNPLRIYADDVHFYITEEATVYIYNRKDFTLLKKFGKEGEGPGDFKTNPAFRINPRILPNGFLIESMGKTSYFKKDGTMIKEVVHNQGKNNFILGKNLIISEIQENSAGDLFLFHFLCTPQFKKIKKLRRMTLPYNLDKKKFYIVYPFIEFCFFGNKVFMTNGTGMEINGFDDSGQLVCSINHKYQPIKITADHIQAMHHWFKTKHSNKGMYNWFKDKFVFQDYFPAIKTFSVEDGYIYIQTYGKRGKWESEFYVFTITGKFVKTLYLPLLNEEMMDESPHLVKGGCLYQLVEDEEEEVWRLHITPIEQSSPSAIVQ